MVHQTMKISSAKAPRASSKSTSITAPFLKVLRQGTAWVILGSLAACAVSPPPTRPIALVETAGPAVTPALPERPRAVLQRERSRWVAAEWGELPGWGQDRAAELWPALLRGCVRPVTDWAALCARASLAPPADDNEATLWLMQHLQPYRVEANDGEAQGMITGYYEPQLDATRKPQGRFQTPVLGPPADLQQRRPYLTRQQIDTEPRAKLRAPELMFLEDPLDLLVLQIQGSGRLRLNLGDGSQQWVRMAFAGHNDQPYQSIGKTLIERGELRPGEASWPAIRDWMRRNPQKVRELLWVNPRYVFFREEALPDANIGPRGAQGVALTPGRSIAVDRASIPYGTPVWLDTTEPLSNTELRRLVMAQDTGSAITGAVRADYFWGWGVEAEQQAGRMKQPLRLWALWPRAAGS